MRTLMLGVCLVAGVTIVAVAQNPASQFEVATVKLNKSGDPGQFIRRQPGGRVTVTNMPARQLVAFAYQLAGFQLVGGPAWMDTDHFDIVAKLDGNPEFGPPGSGPDPIQLAMRALLAERFKLKVRRESREMDIYNLVMAKPGGSPGPGLKPSTTDCAALAGARRGGPPPGAAGGPPAPPADGAPFCGLMGNPGRIRMGGFPLSQFTTMLAGQTGRMVVDRTGLAGNWDFTLTFAPEFRGQPPPGVNIPAPDPDAPSLFTALQEQLGLKLESARAPVDVTVIDAVEHPTED